MNASQFRIKFAKRLDAMVTSDVKNQYISQWRAGQATAPQMPVEAVAAAPCRNTSRFSVRRMLGLKLHAHE